MIIVNNLMQTELTNVGVKLKEFDSFIKILGILNLNLAFIEREEFLFKQERYYAPELTNASAKKCFSSKPFSINKAWASFIMNDEPHA